MSPPAVIPSVLALRPEELVEKLDICRSLAPSCQVDLMDGRFAPLTTVGAEQLLALETKIEVAAHLMVAEPESWSRKLIGGVAEIIFHFESTSDPGGLAEMISGSGTRVGLALNPGTGVDQKVEEALELCDAVVFMGVEPGDRSSPFHPGVLSRVTVAEQRHPNLTICWDGGVSLDTIGAISKAGAEIIYAGRSVFENGDPVERMALLREAAGT